MNTEEANANIEIQKYAFIDVLNTSSTTQRMLGFIIGWNKLCMYLKDEKDCTQVFLYTGIENDDIKTAEEFDFLSNNGYIVKNKSIFAYKNKDKKVEVICDVCKNKIVETINMGYTKKSNCDVELSVDMIERAGPNTEMYIFTGDGDFEYLIRKALEKGVGKLYIVSYANKYKKSGNTISRFSIKLRHIIADNPEKVFYISLLDMKDKIKKESI
jgi:uncharacterized LabA/DUF88 family protein